VVRTARDMHLCGLLLHLRCRPYCCCCCQVTVLDKTKIDWQDLCTQLHQQSLTVPTVLLPVLLLLLPPSPPTHR
jgi:hypothetical protein